MLIAEYGNDKIEVDNTLPEEIDDKIKASITAFTPRRFRKDSFDKIIPIEHKKDVIVSFNSLFGDNPLGLFLHGGVGVGKTSTLYIMYRIYLKKMTSVLYGSISDGVLIGEVLSTITFMTYFDVVKEMRDGLAKDTVPDTIPKYLSKPILFIDDLGRGYEDKSGWNRALISELIDYRWRNCLATFFTSNKGPGELNKYLNQETIDRILDQNWCKLLEYKGNTKRNIKRPGSV